MIESLLPPEAVWAEHFGPDPSARLLPEEEPHVAQAVARRREEFTTVRACARRAFAALGLPPGPVLPGVRNAPRWPAGVVGSMTHCDGYRAAVLARATDLAAIGIDAEPDLPLPDGVLEAISLPGERARLGLGGPAAPRPHGGRTVCRDRLLFSAKEAVYKSWYPLLGTELDFHEADISFHGGPDGTERAGGTERADSTVRTEGTGGVSGTFTARILRPEREPGGRLVEEFTGRWLSERGILVTAIGVPAPRTVPR
ncbi:4'-phosphopantetheinyl transferase superfamily protein [Streptomyces clavuligerus]|uniref:Phosphopantetheinyl transferase n=3 Tax=Streptomyces clavuligerus TaxID=1901 RepID=B5H0R7_STRCL|nr:4'-phosphopantetheinyl transferase superfamily protein [Streptomyces clavuligerus]ANW21644.1 4'-phosphopantetheinyl transferase [Streptomyces clavuligerus]AXU16271.1 4'-phosphopantetheinyl transferase [Streptomyces clavuligerus]EDY52163.1 phosphopantetheinyl transferase [Streptomyces clavuligerus]EFG05178.1 Phosphopantetheinyl transferase [Streptomyces clavuligerus]MBY6306429.1 4'-phosphopantetheinyl transferase superfamily protein [Streptomyces clavuligerus]